MGKMFGLLSFGQGEKEFVGCVLNTLAETRRGLWLDFSSLLAIQPREMTPAQQLCRSVDTVGPTTSVPPHVSTIVHNYCARITAL
jgi:hypothetical protein